MYSVAAARYSFHLRAEEDLSLPRYKGSTFRGGFGQALKRVVCISRHRSCGDCLLRERCIYIQIFEPEERSLKDKGAPSVNCVPYIIEPPLEERSIYQKGETVSFQIVLLGRAIDYLPYFIYAFIELGRYNGIGRRGGRFSVERVQLLSLDNTLPETIYSSVDKKVISHIIEPVRSDDIPEKRVRKLTIGFITPTKLTYNGRVLHERMLTFNIFMKNLFRRISNLVMFHGGEFLEQSAIMELLRRSEEIEVRENGLSFCPWTRYSHRQERKISLYGFTGRITFEGDITPFYPCIYLGQLLHIGKSTTMGMGMYRISDDL